MTINDRAEEFIRYYRESVIGDSVDKLLDRDCARRTREFHRLRLMGYDVPEFYRVLAIRGDGKKSWIMIRAKAYRMGKELYSTARVVQHIATY